MKKSDDQGPAPVGADSYLRRTNVDDVNDNDDHRKNSGCPADIICRNLAASIT